MKLRLMVHEECTLKELQTLKQNVAEIIPIVAFDYSLYFLPDGYAEIILSPQDAVTLDQLHAISQLENVVDGYLRSGE